ncbi:uncharacterized protein LOC101208268 [Cucumis sativus]|uniref:DUF7780 domain-containing protein n=1 Tax=Cucumis sativus TaxID=3659 RepID=A0A0A0KWA6_CUCSA|nr:uncharacterized protein LOC101208268 [Cucumis sativus]KGN53838.1 hypothetical protein Csa_019133 [Cucumis sativus]
MGLTLTGKSKSTAGDNWGMGLLLVFFSEDSPSPIADHKNLFPSSSPSSSSTSGRRSNYNLLTKAQSTISVCALLVFLSLLLFTLSTFEPTIKMNLTPPRRLLTQKSMPIELRKPLGNRWNWFRQMWKQKPAMGKTTTTDAVSTVALQRMGTLYMRGTRAMPDLTVVHVSEDIGEEDFRLFLRLFHRSGVTAKSDSVFVFPSPAFSLRFGPIIRQENESFLKLLGRYRNLNGTSRSAAAGFDVTQLFKSKEKKETEEPIWGKRVKRLGNVSNGGEDELTRLSYGSVVSFDAGEIDPENSLSGFSDHIPMSLRRWSCYPMLLGRVRRNFKHVMLIDAKSSLLLGDPLSRVRNKGTESVIFFTNKHSKKNSEKSNSHHLVNPSIVIGGARGIRRLSNAAAVEIVRILMQHKKKNSVSDSGVLSRLVNSEFLLKNVKVIMASESIPEASSLTGVELESVGSLSAPEKMMFHKGNNGNSGEINSVIMKKICSSEIDSSVYTHC